jgi:hypothetical protein
MKFPQKVFLFSKSWRISSFLKKKEFTREYSCLKIFVKKGSSIFLVILFLKFLIQQINWGNWGEIMCFFWVWELSTNVAKFLETFTTFSILKYWK